MNRTGVKVGLSAGYSGTPLSFFPFFFALFLSSYKVIKEYRDLIGPK